MLTHRNIVAKTIQFATWYAFEEESETCISALSSFHGGGIAGTMNVPLYRRGDSPTLSPVRSGRWVRAIERYRAARFLGVPTM